LRSARPNSPRAAGRPRARSQSRQSSHAGRHAEVRPSKDDRAAVAGA
jgi:hypothetical protein